MDDPTHFIPSYNVRKGTKHIYTLTEGERWARFEDVFIIVHPERPPKIVYADGTIQELTCLPDPPSPSAK